MAQTGKQTNLLYGSVTPGAVPAADRLTTNAGGVEIALNAADGKLFFKDTAGVVRLIADVNAVAGGGNANITGGVINGVNIGSTVPGSGTFTTLTTQTIKVPITGILKSNPVTGVVTAVAGVDYLEVDTLGQPDGIATLGGDGKVPASQLPATMVNGMHYLGLWDAQNGVPPIQDGVGEVGQFYKVRTEGNTELDGESTWFVGDSVVFNGTKWERISEGAPSVTSVNGMAGDVTINRSSLGAASAGVNNDITALNALAVPISVAQGGTGKNSLTGMLKGAGNAPVATAVADLDYLAPTTGSSGQLLASNGAGGLANVTLGAGLQMVGTTLSSTGGGGSPGGGGGGTVTSVALNGGSTGLSVTGGPITTSGIMSLVGTLNVTNGGTGKTDLGTGLLKGNGTSPLVSAVPGTDYALPPRGALGTIVGSDGQGGLTAVTVGQGLSLVSGILTTDGASSGNGSVTSVAASGGTTGLTFSGGPITSTGTLTLGGRLSVPSGGTGAGTLSGILKGNGTAAIGSAVANVDYAVPPTGTVNQLLGNNGLRGFSNVTIGVGLAFNGTLLSATNVGTVTRVDVSGGTTGMTFNGGSITTEGTVTLSGTLGVANGGTGATTLTGLVKGNGTAAMSAAVPGTDYALPPTGADGTLVVSNGAGGFKAAGIGNGLAYDGGGNLTATIATALPDDSIMDAKINSNAGIAASKLRHLRVAAGAAARTVNLKLNDLISVKDFGAVGDGVVDDTVAIASAIGFAKSVGGSVFFPSGTYIINPANASFNGRVILYGNGDVTIKGGFRYHQLSFPVAAGAATPLTDEAPYFSASGLNFEGVDLVYGLVIRTEEQGSFINTFYLVNCKFYGDYGLQCQNTIGFELEHCDFNSRVIGSTFEGCTNGTVMKCRWNGQAYVGAHLTNTADHGQVFERTGGENIKFNGCEWAVCNHGLIANQHMWLCVDNSLFDYCNVPVLLIGAQFAKLSNTYMGAAQVANMFVGVPGYVAPATIGVAMRVQPGGYVEGSRPVSVSCHGCEFINYVQGSNQPIVSLTGYGTSTWPTNASLISFLDCLFYHPFDGMTNGHTAPTLLSIENAVGVRVAFNKFFSKNCSSTLTSAWRAVGCTDVQGFANVFMTTQSNVVIRSPNELTITQVYVQSTDPGSVPAGTIWVTP